MRFELEGKRVYVAGHRGLVGSAVVRRLAGENCEILTADHRALDLTRQSDTEAWLRANRPDAVFLAAAQVGGIAVNQLHQFDFLADNLAIALNVIQGSYAVGVQKLVFFGSSCIYPRLAAQPMTEDMILTGPLEPTNEGYAVAKLAGLKLIEKLRLQHGADYVTILPSNVYGPNDNYDLHSSHVPAALIRRFDEAKRGGAPSVAIWGTGRARREFLSSDDLADAAVFVSKNYSGEAPLNVGCGEDISIADFARLVASVVGFDGSIEFDTTRADGMPRKFVDIGKLAALGWRPRITLKEGLEISYADYRARFVETVNG